MSLQRKLLLTFSSFSLSSHKSSDFMEDFLEPPDSDFPDIHYGTTTMSSEVKKDKSQHSLDDRLRDNIPKTIIAKSS